MSMNNESVKVRAFELNDGDTISVYNNKIGEHELFKYKNELFYRVEEYIEFIEGIPMTRHKSVGEGYAPSYINEIVK